MTIGETYWFPTPDGIENKRWHTRNMVTGSGGNLVVVSHTVTAGTTFKALYYSVSGKLGEGVMILQEKIGGVWTDVDALSTPQAQHTIQSGLMEPIEFSAGTEIRIMARNTHTANQMMRIVFMGVEV